MKKLFSIMIALFVLMTTQVGTVTPAYAAPSNTPIYPPVYDIATKVAAAKLSGVYEYDLQVSKDNKLIATGTYDRREEPTKHTVQLQITKTLTTKWYVGTDGIAYIQSSWNTFKRGQGWELKTTIPVVRSASSTGADTISMEIALTGLDDGIYNLQEVVSKGGKNEGHFGSHLFVVVHKGTVSLQSTWQWSHLTSWYHDKGFWIN